MALIRIKAEEENLVSFENLIDWTLERDIIDN